MIAWGVFHTRLYFGVFFETNKATPKKYGAGPTFFLAVAFQTKQNEFSGGEWYLMRVVSVRFRTSREN